MAIYKRSDKEWLAMCDKITAGYVPAADKRQVYTSRHYLVDRLLRWYDPAKPGTKMLDWGCGNGRLPMGLVNSYPMLDYTGIDVIKPVIEFCNKAFKPWGKFYKFIHVDVKNSRYWSIGSVAPRNFRLPFKDGEFDVVFCNSLFTHTGDLDVADNFIHEAHRVIKPDGMLIATWIIRDAPDYSEAVTVYTERMVRLLYDGLFALVGRLGCPETPNGQTEIAARKL